MKKRGFTLAELLITLVIIGVIAAIALPQFITGMYNQSNASRLSTVITDYENIFGMMMQKENKSNIFETEFGKAWTGNDREGMKTAMTKYTQIARSSQNTLGLGYISLAEPIIPAVWADVNPNPCASYPNNGFITHPDDPHVGNGSTTYELGQHGGGPTYSIDEACCVHLNHYWYYNEGRMSCWYCPQRQLSNGIWVPTYLWSTDTDCHVCPQGAQYMRPDGQCSNCPEDFPYLAGMWNPGEGALMTPPNQNSPHPYKCSKCQQNFYYYSLDGNPAECHRCSSSMPYYYGTPKTCQKCPAGKVYKSNQPASGWSCVPRNPGSGYCCTETVIDCSTNPCAAGCPEQGCCTSQGYNWYHGSCCQTNGGNWDGSQCCDDSHFYDGKCNKCEQGYQPNWLGNCVPVCPQGQTFVNGNCACPSGTTLINNQCINCQNPCTQGCPNYDPAVCGGSSSSSSSSSGENLPTPFHKIGKEPATTDDISFTYAESHMPTGANVFYSAVEKYDGNKRAATIYIDTNGKSWPNTFGRDVFALALDQDGHLYPYGSVKAAVIFTTNVAASTWRGTSERYGCTKRGTYNGLGCTARLIENNYKVDY